MSKGEVRKNERETIRRDHNVYNANKNKEVEELFKENDQVFIKNEFAVAKGQPRFKDRGQIVECL
jgi:ribosomal protein L21E